MKKYGVDLKRKATNYFPQNIKMQKVIWTWCVPKVTDGRPIWVILVLDEDATYVKKKKYSLYQVKNFFAAEGYKVLDSIYINGKVPIKVICPYGHETEICLNNFLSGKRCGRCRRRNETQNRMKKLEFRAKINLIPLWETSGRFLKQMIVETRICWISGRRKNG